MDVFFVVFLALDASRETGERSQTVLYCTISAWGYEEDKNVFKHANKNACLVLFSYRGLWYLAIFYPKV